MFSINHRASIPRGVLADFISQSTSRTSKRGLAEWLEVALPLCGTVVVSSHLVVVRFIPGDSIDVNQHFPDDRCIDRELRCRAAMAPTCHEGTCDAIGEHVYNYLTLTDP